MLAEFSRLGDYAR